MKEGTAPISSAQDAGEYLNVVSIRCTPAG